jgi:Domain of unknown function (DUF389)
MHRTIQISVPAAYTDTLLEGLERMEEVIGLSVHRGAARKPPGDVVTVHTLNRGADAVLRYAAAGQAHGSVSITTAELASIIDPEHRRAVDADVDEALWEEAETGLRHQGRVTPNYLTLMALGGAIATVGLVAEAVPQAIAFVASAVIAPGFEPIAKIPLGLALRRWRVLRRGLVSTGAGYAVLVAAAALTFLLLRLTGAATVEALVENPEVGRLSHPGAGELLVSACAAAAGMTMIVAYRRSVIAGPLIALVLVPAAATIGAALAGGQTALALEGLERLAIDAVLVVLLGASVVLAKQALVHRRAPVV